MHLRFRGCPVVLDIELYVSAWYHKTRRVRMRARHLLLLLLLTTESKERWLVVCGITFKPASIRAETISCQSEHQKKSPHPKHPRLKNHFIISRNLMLLVACCDKHIYLYLWHAQYAAHTAPTHLPAGIEGVRTVTVYRLPIRLPAKSALTLPVV